jgi:hypothetical protein
MTKNKSIDNYTANEQQSSQVYTSRRIFLRYVAGAIATGVSLGGCTISLTNKMDDLSGTSSAYVFLQEAEKLRATKNAGNLYKAGNLLLNIPRVEGVLPAVKEIYEELMPLNSSDAVILAKGYEIKKEEYGKEKKVSLAEVIRNSKK